MALSGSGRRRTPNGVGAADELGAVRVAFWLALAFTLRGEHAVAGGWVGPRSAIARAENRTMSSNGVIC